MECGTKAKRIRIYISSTDKFKSNSLYEVLVYAAKRYGMSGATVFRGIMGFGISSVVHTQKLWEINEKSPVVVEIIDDAEKVNGFIDLISPYVEMAGKGCLVTIDDTEVIMLKEGHKK